NWCRYRVKRSAGLSRKPSRGRSSPGARGMNHWTNCRKNELSLRKNLTLSLWKDQSGALKFLLPRDPEPSLIPDENGSRSSEVQRVPCHGSGLDLSGTLLSAAL